MRTGLVLVAMVLFAAPVHALDGYLLVGEDPAGDNDHRLLDEVSVGGQISPGRTDLLGLDVAGDEETLTLRLRIAEAPAGTGGYLYRVGFTAGGSLYWACWTVQWVGGQVSEENLKGCSRFTEGTQVGPEVTGPTHLDGTGVFAPSTPGVERGQVDGQEYIQWVVARTEVMGAAVEDLSGLFTESWFRGGSLENAGSTTDSQYHWSRSDVGPDEGVWELVLAVSEPLNVTFTAPTGPSILAPGESVVLSYTVNATGMGPVNFTLDGVPANWTVALDFANLTAPAMMALNVTVQVPMDAVEGVTEMGLVASSGDTELASVPVRVQVLFAEGLLDEGDDDGNETEGPDTSADAPGPGALLGLAVVGLIAVLRRRRHA